MLTELDIFCRAMTMKIAVLFVVLLGTAIAAPSVDIELRELLEILLERQGQVDTPSGPPFSSKSDDAQEQAARLWMKSITGESLKEGQTLGEALKDGIYLCKLATSLGHPYKCNTSTNTILNGVLIRKFIDAMVVFGVPKILLFEPLDLLNDKYDGRVISALLRIEKRQQEITALLVQ